VKLKLFKVVVWNCFECTEEWDATSTCYVIAGNEVEAKRVTEEELWTLGGMSIKSVEEIDMTLPQVLCVAYDEAY
jgi:hypothetical protein